MFLAYKNVVPHFGGKMWRTPFLHHSPHLPHFPSKCGACGELPHFPPKCGACGECGAAPQNIFWKFSWCTTKKLNSRFHFNLTTSAHNFGLAEKYHFLRDDPGDDNSSDDNSVTY